MSSVVIKSGKSFTAREHLGTSVALIGKEFRPSIKTVNGNRPAYKVDVVILSGDNAGFYYEEALVFQSALVNQLKKKAAQNEGDYAVIGTLVERPTQDGENAYLLVDAPTDAEILVAAKYGV